MDEGRLPTLASNEDIDLITELSNPSTELPQDLTGFQVWFYLKSNINLPDASAEIAVQGTVLDQVSFKGQALFQISDTVTRTLREGVYWWSVNTIEPGGRSSMVKRDTVAVVRNPYAGM